ncbi:hypothetical protein BASA81_002294 [Batrachochytrium salamandrivorans]|nr:hypothetical protein BASA81_002294 [Batrachochytrium salamandrivorans]
MTTTRPRQPEAADRPVKSARLSLLAPSPAQDIKQIPLPSGSVILADVSQYFASFSPTTEPRNSLAQEFFDYLQKPDE